MHRLMRPDEVKPPQTQPDVFYKTLEAEIRARWIHNGCVRVKVSGPVYNIKDGKQLANVTDEYRAIGWHVMCMDTEEGLFLEFSQPGSIRGYK